MINYTLFVPDSMNMRFSLGLCLCLFFPFLLCSCAKVQEQREVIVTVPKPVDLVLLEKKNEKITQLQKEVSRLKAELVKQQGAVTRLQRNLLAKHQESDSYQQTNEKLLAELVTSRAKVFDNCNKIEAATLIAETAAMVVTASSKSLNKGQESFLKRAETLVKESEKKVKAGQYEDAAYFCGKAAEMLKLAELAVDQEDSGESAGAVVFTSPLKMLLGKNGNVRSVPSLDGKILVVLKAGNSVLAKGYKKDWVKIRLSEYEEGWVHLSLLN